MKKQIWFRPEQIELTVECLKFVRGKLNEGTVLSDAHKLAGRYVYKRLSELINLFGVDNNGDK